MVWGRNLITGEEIKEPIIIEVKSRPGIKLSEPQREKKKKLGGRFRVVHP